MAAQITLASQDWTMNPAAEDMPSESEIRRELNLILASPAFRDSLRLTSFLKFVVDAALSGKAGQIKSYTIAVEALGRNADFDPQADPIVRVEAGRLRRALAQYYATVGRDDRLVIDLPRGTYVPSFRPRNMPIGLRKHPFSGRRALYHLASRRRRRFFSLIATVALAVSIIPDLAMVAWQQLNDRIAAPYANHSEAVVALPIPLLPKIYVEPTSVSGAALSNSISAIMFSRRLIDSIAAFDDVAVVVPPPGGGPPASADYRLGSAIHYYADGEATVAVSAIDAAQGSVIWSKTYEGRVHNPVPEQRGRMTREMMSALMQPFGVIASREAMRHANNDSMADPYRCVLDSHDYLRSYDLRRSGPVRACLEASIARQAAWVSPLVQLARVDVRDYQFDFAGTPAASVALNSAFTIATRAIQLKPTSAAAYNAFQDVLVARGDLLGAKKAGETALQLNPYDRFAVVDHGLLLLLLGETVDGMALIRQVTTDNPVPASRLRFALALTAYLHGDMATVLAQTGDSTAPIYPPTLMLRILAASKTGDRADARGTLNRLYARYPALRTDLHQGIRHFLPDAALAERIASDFVAVTTDLTQ